MILAHCLVHKLITSNIDYWMRRNFPIGTKYLSYHPTKGVSQPTVGDQTPDRCETWHQRIDEQKTPRLSSAKLGNVVHDLDKEQRNIVHGPWNINFTSHPVFFLHKPPLYMYKESQKIFCTEIFCTFKKVCFLACKTPWNIGLKCPKTY